MNLRSLRALRALKMAGFLGKSFVRVQVCVSRSFTYATLSLSPLALIPSLPLRSFSFRLFADIAVYLSPLHFSTFLFFLIHNVESDGQIRGHRAPYNWPSAARGCGAASMVVLTGNI